jgi:hypothetical protein
MAGPERGFALVAALMTMVLVMAMGAGLVLATSAEAVIGGNFARSRQAFYGAEAAGEWALADLQSVADWPAMLAGGETSWFADGPAGGSRALADGSTFDLGRVVAAAAGWTPFAWGPLADLLDAGLRPRCPPLYVVVLVAADPAGPDHLRMRVQSFGPRASRAVLELGVVRGAGGARFESWRDVR